MVVILHEAWFNSPCWAYKRWFEILKMILISSESNNAWDSLNLHCSEQIFITNTVYLLDKSGKILFWFHQWECKEKHCYPDARNVIPWQFRMQETDCCVSKCKKTWVDSHRLSTHKIVDLWTPRNYFYVLTMRWHLNWSKLHWAEEFLDKNRVHFSANKIDSFAFHQFMIARN